MQHKRTTTSNTSLVGAPPRYSFNRSHMTSPIAESTCLHSDNTSVPKFEWGTTPISPKQRSNSSINLSNSDEDTAQVGGSAEVSGKRLADTTDSSGGGQRRRCLRRFEMPTIDPQVYADVHSKGLASRIVQYHQEGGARPLGRSMSAQSLYSHHFQQQHGHLHHLGGQRSDVGMLKKKAAERGIGVPPRSALYAAPYKAAKHTMPLTRMAPPHKSQFYGHTLSSLLRSNSVLGVQLKQQQPPSLVQPATMSRSEEELSHENRPILHPPPTENDLAPTRSVLDVLKEISRKRINSDEPDSDSDVSKKYCSRTASVDSHVRAPPNITIGNNKRQREHFMSAIGHSLANSGAAGRDGSSATSPSLSMVTTTPPRRRQQLLPEAQAVSSSAAKSTADAASTSLSPEQQQIKKRLCSYNNDVSSSLSSSRIHANKRAFYEQQNGSPKATASLNRRTDGTHKDSANRNAGAVIGSVTKAQTQAMGDVRFGHLSQSLSCHTPITPIPPTPSGELAIAGIVRNTSAPAYGAPGPLAAAAVVKPTLTLFNKVVDPADSDSTDKRLLLANTDDMAGHIPFIKPKKLSAVATMAPGVRNPLMQRVQKTKLALMLCSLRGELYQGKEDEEHLGDIFGHSESAVIPVNDDSGRTTTATAVAASTAPGGIACNAALSTAISTPGSVPSIDTADAVAAVGTTSAKALAPLAAVSPVATSSIGAAPILGGFKFTPPSTNSGDFAATTSVGTTKPTAVTPAKPISPLVGLKLTPAGAATAAVGVVAPTFSFGSTNKTQAAASNVTSTATTTAAPSTVGFPPLAGGAGTGVLGGFKFGEVPPSVVSASTPVPTLNFKFGGVGPIAPEAVTTEPPNSMGVFSLAPVVPTPSPAFSFGLNTSAAPTAATQTTTLAASAAPQITFGGSGGTNSTKSLNFAAGVLAFSAPATATATATPAASAVTQPMKPAAAAFSFGSSNAASLTSASALTTSMLPQSATGAGGAACTFGQKTLGSAAPFSFGGNTVAAGGVATTTATQNSGNNNTFSFGITQNGTGKAATAATTGGAFTFGGGGTKTSSAATAPSATLGAVPATASSLFTFGSASGAQQQQQQQSQQPQQQHQQQQKPTTLSFGGATSSPFVFGTSDGGVLAGDGPKTNFAFGGVPADGSGNGGGATNGSSSKTGVVKPNFNFGGAGGGDANQNKTFSFGSPNVANAGAVNDRGNNSGAANIFGAAISAATSAPSANTARGFSFGGGAGGGLAAAAAATTNKPTAVTAPTNTFNFGGGQSSTNTVAITATNNNGMSGNNTTTGGPFSFGSAAPPAGIGAGLSTNSNAAKPFTFGGGGGGGPNNISAGNNLFAMGMTSPSAAAAPPTPGLFNFSAGGSTGSAASLLGHHNSSNNNNNTSDVSSSSNIFAPPPGGERLIRKATRRLQKS